MAMEATEPETMIQVPLMAAQIVTMAITAGRITLAILLILSQLISIPLRLCRSYSAQFLEYLV